MLATTLFAIDGSVSFGWQDKRTGIYHHGPFYMDMSLSQPFDSYTIYGLFGVEMDKTIDAVFPAPSQSHYAFGVSVELSPFVFSVEHGESIIIDGYAKNEYTKVGITITGHAQ